jgi:hypothetical protein
MTPFRSPPESLDDSRAGSSNLVGPRYTGRGYLSLISGIIFCLRKEEKKKVIRYQNADWGVDVS